jgi:hypothetical protein
MPIEKGKNTLISPYVVIYVVSWNSPCCYHFIVVAVINHKQSSWPDERVHVAQSALLIRVTSVRVCQMRKRISETNHRVKESIRRLRQQLVFDVVYIVH